MSININKIPLKIMPTVNATAGGSVPALPAAPNASASEGAAATSSQCSGDGGKTLSAAVDKLSEGGQVNGRDTKSLQERLPKGLTQHNVNGSDVTLYNVDDVLKAQAVGEGEADFDDIYNQIASAANAEEGENAEATAKKSANGINGEFDERISQGGTGDCWLISGLLSLNSTEEGRQIIKDAITVNDDGSVDVNFKGAGVSYNITPEEIKKYDTDYLSRDAYSNGDNDMLVFELAVSKLKKDIALGKVELGVSENSYEGLKDASLEGGFAAQVIYFLTGRTSQTYGVQSNKKSDIANGLANSTIYKVLENAAKDDSTVLSCAMYYGEKSAKCIDGRTFNVDLTNYGHAFAITDVDAANRTVTIVNPWDSTVSYTMSWSEFANMGIGLISSTELNGDGNYVAPSVQNGGVIRSNNNSEDNNSKYNGNGTVYNKRSDNNSSDNGNNSGSYVNTNTNKNSNNNANNYNNGNSNNSSYVPSSNNGGYVISPASNDRIAESTKNLFVDDTDKSMNRDEIKENLVNYLRGKLDKLGIKYNSSDIDKMLDSCINSTDFDKYLEIYAEAEIMSALEREVDNAVEIASEKIKLLKEADTAKKEAAEAKKEAEEAKKEAEEAAKEVEEAENDVQEAEHDAEEAQGDEKEDAEATVEEAEDAKDDAVENAEEKTEDADKAEENAQKKHEESLEEKDYDKQFLDEVAKFLKDNIF